MRVAYLVNEFPAVTEPYVSEEVAALLGRGHQVVVLSAFRPGRAAPADVQTSRVPSGIDVRYLSPVAPFPLVASCLWFLRHLKVLRPTLRRVLFGGTESARDRAKGLKHVLLGVYCARLLAGYQVDHLHAHHGYFAAFGALVASRILGVGYTLTLHGSDVLLDGLFLDAKVGSSELTFTVSEYNAALLRETYAFPADKIALRRLGVEACDLGNGRAAPTTLLSAGRLTRVKNQQLLIRAVAELAERGREVRALIVGGGEDEGALRALAHELGVSERAIFLGWLPRPRLLELFRRADICVLTSLSEGLPLVLMEAMAHGAIAVAPKITGIPELIQDGRNGFLYSVDDCRALVAVLSRVLDSSPERLGAVRAAALQTIRREYDATTNTNRFIERLARLVEQRGSG